MAIKNVYCLRILSISNLLSLLEDLLATGVSPYFYVLVFRDYLHLLLRLRRRPPPPVARRRPRPSARRRRSYDWGYYLFFQSVLFLIHGRVPFTSQ